MTLIVTAINEEYGVLVSDRRLTRDGVLYEDQSNKAAVFDCRDGRLAMAFTGLAEAPGLITRRWMLGALADACLGHHRLMMSVARFTELATAKLRLIRAPDKRLSFMMVGFVGEPSGPRPCAWLVSNFEAFGQETSSTARDEFRLSFRTAQRPAAPRATAVLCAGADAALDPAGVDTLCTMVSNRKPARAVVEKAVHLIASAADSPRSRGVIGKNCTSVILPSDFSQPAEGGYHPADAQIVSHGVSYVEGRGGEYGVIEIMEPERELAIDGKPVVLGVPRVGRNAPCPCGSGKKYKKCHGR